jgi:hypothetical protein
VSDQLLDALNTGQVSTGRCSVGQFLRSLPPEERDAILVAMRRCSSDAPDTKNFNFSWLSKTLEENGKPLVKGVAFRRHVRGECTCDGSLR